MFLTRYFRQKRRRYIAILFLFLFINTLARGIYFNQSNRIKVVAETKATVLSMHTNKKQTKSPIPTITPKISSGNMIQTISHPPSSHTVYFGLWTEGMWDDHGQTFHPEKLTQIQNSIGKKAAIAHFFTGWENVGREAIIQDLQRISSNGWRPMLSINPYFTPQCQANGQTLYKAIAEGNCDVLLHAMGKNLKQYGSPVFLRFAWEMNIESMEWSIQKTGSTPADYINAWRRMHTIITEEGATNVLWVFSPNTVTAQSIAYTELYPGDAYVDWLGLDGYNWGTTQSWSSWQTFGSIFTPSYNALTRVAPAKPLMLAEVNTTDVGGDKEAWYQDMLATQVPYNFPKINAVIFYNENRTGSEHVNWNIDVSATSLQSFSKNIQTATYLSSF